MSDRRVDRRDVGSWLSGPTSVTGVSGFPGEALGRPSSGPGSIAGSGRRLVSLIIDWVLCLLIARGIVGPEALQPNGSLIPVLVLVIENVLLVGTAGATIGQRVMRLQVERVDGSRPGLGAAALRAVLLGLAVPAITLIWNNDSRGLHELASGTLVARH